MINEIEFFKKNGYYHAKNQISTLLIEKLKSEWDFLIQDKMKRFNYQANHDKNRWNMLLPSEFILHLNDFLMDNTLFELLASLFKEDFALVFFSSDIAAPGSEFQTSHQDTNDFGIALNIPLVQSDENNGSTQIFPSTHLDPENPIFTTKSNLFSDEEVMERVKNQQPIHLNMNLGDYSIRDLRLIHRGTPNYSSSLRPYLSLIFLKSSHNQAPHFETIQYGLKIFEKLRNEAITLQNLDLLNFANILGRSIMIYAQSDRIKRPIPKFVSDKMQEQTLYYFRFAYFEDIKLNQRVTRSDSMSDELLHEIETAQSEFQKLKRKINEV